MINTNKSSEFFVKKANLRHDRADILQLWKEGFPAYSNWSQKLDWYYIANSSGKAFIFLLQKNGLNIGVKGIGGKNWLLNGCVRKAGLFSDLMVKQEHRSVGPALKLISEAVNKVSFDFPILYGFPNSKSVVVYKRGGFELLGMMNRYAKPLNYSFYIAKHSKIISIILGRFVDGFSYLSEKISNAGLSRLYSDELTDQFDESFDMLWEVSESEGYCMAQRDRKFLSWRFKNAQYESIKIFTLKLKPGNTLVGYVVYSVSSEYVVTIRDFFAPGNTNYLLVLLKLFSQKMRKMNYISVSMEFFGDMDCADTIKKVGFRVRDSEPIVYRLTEDNIEASDSLKWFITSADRDQ